MSEDYKKLQRKKEIEEKRKRIAEYRERSKKEDDVSTPDISGARTVDDLLKSIEASPHEKPADAPASKEAPKEAPNAEAAAPTTAAPATQHVSRPAAQLTFCSAVFSFDIAPKEITHYSKGMQTRSSDEPEEAQSEFTRTTSKPPKEEAVERKDNSAGMSTSDPDVEAKEKKEQKPAIKAVSDDVKAAIFNSDQFARFFTKATRTVERALFVSKEHNYMVDYEREADAAQKGRRESKEVKLSTKLFDERWSKHRALTDLSWSPKYQDLVLASYSQNETSSHDSDGVVLLWSTQNMLNRPEHVFNCQSPVMSCSFNKFDPNMIIGGTYSGQIVLWDTRSKGTPVLRSPLSSIAHTHPIYALSLVGTQNANNLVTISTDGRLCVWSLESLSAPQEVLELHSKKSKVIQSTAPIAVTCMGVPEGEVNEVFVGSEEGSIHQCFRHGSKAGGYERFDGHSGPITSLSFHPSKGSIDFSSLFLSSSVDWSIRLWNPRVSTQPIHTFEDASDYIYGVSWSPTHPALFASVDGRGGLYCWNLNEDPEQPITRTNVSTRALNKISWSIDGRRLATGDSDGSLYIYDVGDMGVPRAEEWSILEERLRDLGPRTAQTAALPKEGDVTADFAPSPIEVK